ncbi:MAG: hypothetical protein KUG77_07350 [Nannocystaceae bacterium]|nr:hypothetical protein [Nannocystaceae bacterium]
MMQLTREQRATIRSTARWAIAVGLALAVNMVLGLRHITDGSFRDGVLLVVAILITGWQVLALALAALAFSARPTAARFETGLYGLRAFAKVGALALPLVTIAAGATCDLTLNTTTTVTAPRVEAR